jgi:hypothetical protein
MKPTATTTIQDDYLRGSSSPALKYNVRPKVAPRWGECWRRLEEEKGVSPWDGHQKGELLPKLIGSCVGCRQEELDGGDEENEPR